MRVRRSFLLLLRAFSALGKLVDASIDSGVSQFFLSSAAAPKQSLKINLHVGLLITYRPRVQIKTKVLTVNVFPVIVSKNLMNNALSKAIEQCSFKSNEVEINTCQQAIYQKHFDTKSIFALYVSKDLSFPYFSENSIEGLLPPCSHKVLYRTHLSLMVS
jgi:hypothetical protein